MIAHFTEPLSDQFRLKKPVEKVKRDLDTSADTTIPEFRILRFDLIEDQKSAATNVGVPRSAPSSILLFWLRVILLVRVHVSNICCYI
jgi:hypothetical protein